MFAVLGHQLMIGSGISAVFRQIRTYRTSPRQRPQIRRQLQNDIVREYRFLDILDRIDGTKRKLRIPRKKYPDTFIRQLRPDVIRWARKNQVRKCSIQRFGMQGCSK